MRGRTLILVVLIIVLALVAVLAFMMRGGGDEETEGTPSVADMSGVPDVGSQQGGDDEETSAEANVGTLEEILVAYQNITRGMVIPDDAIGTQLWPRESLPEEGNFYRADQRAEVVGRYARTDIARGAPILVRQIVDSPALLADVGSDVAAYLNREPAGTVAVSIPLDTSGVGQVAYGIQDGDRVDVILSFLFVDVDPEFQTRMPNIYSLIYRMVTGELIIGEPRQGELQTSIFSTEGIIEQPSESAQRPRLVTQRTVTNALVVHVGYFDETGILFGKTPTPLGDIGPTALPGEAPVEGEAEQDVTPVPTVTMYRPAIMTLGVSPQDALVLTWAVDAEIPIMLALRQAGDLTVTDTLPVSLDYMIRTYNAEPPAALEFTTEPGITSIRRFDIDSLYDFLTQTTGE